MYAKKQREGSGRRSPPVSKASCKDKEGNAIKDMWNWLRHLSVELFNMPTIIRVPQDWHLSKSIDAFSSFVQQKQYSDRYAKPWGKKEDKQKLLQKSKVVLEHSKFRKSNNYCGYTVCQKLITVLCNGAPGQELQSNAPVAYLDNVRVPKTTE